MFLCLLWHERYEDNLTFICLNNFANDSKKKKKLTRFLFLHILSGSSGWFFFKGQKFHRGTCQRARFRVQK